MPYSITIDHENKLIRYQHSGRLQVEDIGKAWDEFVKIKEFTHKGYHLLSDYSHARFVFDTEEIETIINILEQMPFLNQKKQALIIDDPYSTAGSLLFENDIYKRSGFNVKVFATKKAALSWIISE